jgi:hypothetical protein
MADVLVVIGAGSIGQDIARRVSAGKHVLLADLNEENAGAAAKTLSDAGFEVSTARVDLSSRASLLAVERALLSHRSPDIASLRCPRSRTTLWQSRRLTTCLRFRCSSRPGEGPRSMPTKSQNGGTRCA